MSKRWPVQDAKSKFSELLDTTLAEGPQIVTKRGEGNLRKPQCSFPSSSGEGWNG